MILNKQFITLKIILLELFSPFFKTKICAILHSWSSMLVLGCLFFFFFEYWLKSCGGRGAKGSDDMLVEEPAGLSAQQCSDPLGMVSDLLHWVASLLTRVGWGLG